MMLSAQITKLVPFAACSWAGAVLPYETVIRLLFFMFFAVIAPLPVFAHIFCPLFDRIRRLQLDYTISL
jgi:hypothetical protein